MEALVLTPGPQAGQRLKWPINMLFNAPLSDKGARCVSYKSSAE
jgi:hypothetical protein